jgi:hypothetical protein
VVRMTVRIVRMMMIVMKVMIMMMTTLLCPRLARPWRRSAWAGEGRGRRRGKPESKADRPSRYKPRGWGGPVSGDTKWFGHVVSGRVCSGRAM